MVAFPTLEFSCHKLQNKSKKLMQDMSRSCQRGKKKPHTVLGCSSQCAPLANTEDLIP